MGKEYDRDRLDAGHRSGVARELSRPHVALAVRKQQRRFHVPRYEPFGPNDQVCPMRPAAAETIPMHDPFKLASVDRTPSAFAFPGLSLPPGGRRYKTAGGCAGRTTVAPRNAPQSTISFSKLACRCTTGVTASSARAREWMPARAVVRRRSLTKGAEGPRQVAVGFARTTAQRFGVEGRSEDLTNLTHDLLPLASIEYRIVWIFLVIWIF